MDPNVSVQAAEGINSSNKNQTGIALYIQTYCNSINMQPAVDLSGIKELASYQSALDDGLKTAKSHANDYLNNIQPNILKNINNIDDYYTLHSSVASTLPPGTSKADWIEALQALKDQSITYQKAAQDISDSLKTLHSNLTTDAAGFGQLVVMLNAAVNGDNGILASDKSELDKMQSKIDGAIAGIAISGLAIVGGGFMVAVGGIADFVTAGTSTPLVVAGALVIAAGVGGEVASAITLNNMNEQKAKLLLKDSTLRAEIKLANGISSGYQSLGNQIKLAVDAATAMTNAWSFLTNDLGSLIKDVQNGIKDDGIMQKVFLNATNKVIITVGKDIDIIKNQMAGVTVITVNKNETVGVAMINALKKAA